MARLRQLVCRHRYEVVERIDAGGDPRLEVTEPLPVGQGESRYGWMRRR